MTGRLLPVAEGAIRAAEREGPIPVYGSAVFQRLDPRDPRWLASVLRAAESWRLDGEPEQVLGRMLAEDQSLARRIRDGSWQICHAWRNLPTGEPWGANSRIADFYPPKDQTA